VKLLDDAGVARLVARVGSVEILARAEAAPAPIKIIARQETSAAIPSRMPFSSATISRVSAFSRSGRLSVTTAIASSGLSTRMSATPRPPLLHRPSLAGRWLMITPRFIFFADAVC